MLSPSEERCARGGSWLGAVPHAVQLSAVPVLVQLRCEGAAPAVFAQPILCPSLKIAESSTNTAERCGTSPRGEDHTLGAVGRRCPHCTQSWGHAHSSASVGGAHGAGLGRSTDPSCCTGIRAVILNGALAWGRQSEQHAALRRVLWLHCTLHGSPPHGSPLSASGPFGSTHNGAGSEQTLSPTRSGRSCFLSAAAAASCAFLGHEFMAVRGDTHRGVTSGRQPAPILHPS